MFLWYRGFITEKKPLRYKWSTDDGETTIHIKQVSRRCEEEASEGSTRVYLITPWALDKS